MAKPTLESLEKRVAALEAALAESQSKKDWRKAVGMFTGSEFMKRVDEEGRQIREAERKAARKKTRR
jgi:hypothetical protein